ncbi:MAG: helix-turn-helix domain-containing protein [Vicinamibacteria bacterium]
MNPASIVARAGLPDPVSMPSDLADPSLFESQADVESAGGERLVLRDILASFERNLIITVLTAAGGNQKRAADALGVLPTTFQEKLKRFGLINHRFGRRTRRGERAAVQGDSQGPRHEAQSPQQENLRK